MLALRSDGSKTDYQDERLERVLSSRYLFNRKEFMVNIYKIEDHKGTLEVYLKNIFIDIDYYYDQFYSAWINEGELLVKIFVNDILVKETEL